MGVPPSFLWIFICEAANLLPGLLILELSKRNLLFIREMNF